jgi:hypothetical protein
LPIPHVSTLEDAIKQRRLHEDSNEPKVPLSEGMVYWPILDNKPNQDHGHPVQGIGTSQYAQQVLSTASKNENRGPKIAISLQGRVAGLYVLISH